MDKINATTTNRGKLSLVVAIALPVLAILFIAGAVYLPGLFEQPKYDFIYSRYDSNPYIYSGEPASFTVKDGKLIKIQTLYSGEDRPKVIDTSTGMPIAPVEPTLHYYDIDTNTSRPLVLQETSSMKLDGTLRSPDGFEIRQGNNGGGAFPFFYNGPTPSSMYIVGKYSSNKLDIELNSTDYWGSIRFVAWVIE
jgi:hypothetical protein